VKISKSGVVGIGLLSSHGGAAGAGTGRTATAIGAIAGANMKAVIVTGSCEDLQVQSLSLLV
jgi:hypothetical protein